MRSIATFLAQYLQAWPKWSHHNAILLGTTCCMCLATLLQLAATCWVLQPELVCMPWGKSLLQEPGQMGTTSCNIHRCCMKHLTIFKLEPTTPKMLQHVATGWPKVCNILPPTMLWYIALKWCDHLVGTLECFILPTTKCYFSLLQTSGRTRTVCLPDEMVHVTKLEKSAVNKFSVQSWPEMSVDQAQVRTRIHIHNFQILV